MASIATVVTMGFGSFGSVNLLPTLGYGIAAAVQPTGRLEYTIPFGLLWWKFNRPPDNTIDEIDGNTAEQP